MSREIISTHSQDKKRFIAHIIADFLDLRVQVDLQAVSEKIEITTSWSNLTGDIGRYQAVRIDPDPPSKSHLPAKVRSKDLACRVVIETPSTGFGLYGIHLCRR
ncbi:MAG: hypothetical protein JRC68_04535 [Deltaproteobacteria bacterium]|nr:hypothetical protein [Deltaproteobacteria bacterium]